MTRAFDRRFSPFAVGAALRLLGVALIWLAAQELGYGHLDVSRGLLWARRWDVLPIFPALLQAALWLVQAACGAALIAGRWTKPAVRAAAAALALGLTQAYFNQKMLMTLTFLALSLDPPDPRAPDFAETPRPELALAGAQLLLLYLASAAFKLRAGFCGGETLLALFDGMRARGVSGLIPVEALHAWLAAVPGRAAAVATSVVALEAAAPLLLWARPAWGLAAVVALHLAFSLGMPALWPFGLTSLALALLFLPPDTTAPRFARIAG